MIHSWIVRLIAVLILTATFARGESSILAREVPRQITIVVGGDYTDVPDFTVEGSTLVTLDNQIDIPFGVTFYFVPESLVSAALAATPAAIATPDGTLPTWLAGATPIGGPGIAAPYGRTDALLDFVLGSYVLVFDLFDPASGTIVHYPLTYDDDTPFFFEVVEASTDVDPVPTAVAVTPTMGDTSSTEGPTTTEPTSETDPEEDPTEIAELPDDTATVVMTDDAFLLPASFPIGAQTWEVVNQGQLPHAMIVVAIPAGTTPDQLRIALFPSPAESAQTVAFDTSAMTNVGGLGPLAPGLSAAASLDLSPGTYAVFSALPDPATGEPDGAQGLLAVFLIG
jgi:hypothetical protein